MQFDPWGKEPAPNGAEVLDEVHEFLGRFVAYPSAEARVAHTLWIAHAHLMDAWESTPRIAFLSPEPGSGKSRCMEVSELLVPLPVEAINVTPAYLFRKVGGDEGQPTILFDEIDTVFGPKAKDNEEIRGLLNAGHRRGAVAGRCVVRGKTVETEEIPAYCAVALAGLGGLPDTILSRSVIIRMRRRAPGERVEQFRRRLHEADGHELRDRLSVWAESVGYRIGDPWPQMPDGIEDRDADVWEALLAIADLAAGHWPQTARVAAVALVADSKESTPSLGVRLLADLRDIFNGHDVLSTETILEKLNALEEAPWGDLRGHELNARGLAQRLRPYDVTSTNVRIGDQVVKGYRSEDLWDSWERYLPKRKQIPPEGIDRALGALRETSNEALGSPPQESATSATGATDTPRDGQDAGRISKKGRPKNVGPTDIMTLDEPAEPAPDLNLGHLPGRCHTCGYHIETQGHGDTCPERNAS